MHQETRKVLQSKISEINESIDKVKVELDDSERDFKRASLRYESVKSRFAALHAEKNKIKEDLAQAKE